MPDVESAGVSFGKYLLDAELARGGMSRVFEARLRGPGGFEKQLVVKQILPQLAQDPSFVALLVQEANTLVRMSHPNIVPVYELGIVDGVYFLAMERVRGVTVAELLRESALPEALAAELGAQIAEALRYAHERFELVHRDVTPRNVMVDPDGHVRLLDFGIAAPSARTGKGELFGSPGYMSPEQAARKALTPASDLFGLGALLYEAVRGQRAVSEGVAARLLGTQGTDAELAALIDELLASDPTARGSAARTAARLRAWLSRVHPEGAREQLGARVERALERASARPSRGASAAGGGMDGAEASTSNPATSRLTRSIAASETLTEMLAAGATEALPRLTPQTAPARRAWVVAGAALAIAGALALAAVARNAAPSAAVAAHGLPTTEQPALVPARSSPQTEAHAGAGAETVPIAGRGAAVPRSPEARSTAPGEQPAGAGAAANDDAAPGTSATLSINATPWAEARLDGKPLGPTPQRALRAKPGVHVLTLECPPLGRKARVPLRLAAGAHARVLVDMQTEPPTVSVR